MLNCLKAVLRKSPRTWCDPSYRHPRSGSHSDVAHYLQLVKNEGRIEDFDATDSPAPLAVMNLSPSPLTTTSGRSPRA